MFNGLALLLSNHAERTNGVTVLMPSAIVIVNWNCWEDTARCISACGHLTDYSGAVIVVDNGSTDNSVLRLQKWASGLFEVPSTAVTADIACLENRGSEPLKFVGLFDEETLSCQIKRDGLVSRGWYLVKAGTNAGFSGGNNIGLRLAMHDSDCALFWCLNADAIVRADAWTTLASACALRTEPCVSGSVLLNYDRPDSIQTIGSDFSRSTLFVSYRYENEPIAVLNKLPERMTVGYPIGASLLINRQFIEQHGYFDERYFLYYEEPDLVRRLAISEQSFICTRSLVYHKGGRTTGGGSSILDRGLRADYEYNRSRMILARKIGGKTLALSMMAAMYSIIKRIGARRFDLARAVIPACIDGWRCAR